MVELGVLVYSVAMSGVWLRTYQGCIGEKDDGHLIIYDFYVYDSQKTGTRFGALKDIPIEIIKHILTIHKSCELN